MNSEFKVRQAGQKEWEAAALASPTQVALKESLNLRMVIKAEEDALAEKKAEATAKLEGLLEKHGLQAVKLTGVGCATLMSQNRRSVNYDAAKAWIEAKGLSFDEFQSACISTSETSFLKFTAA